MNVIPVVLGLVQQNERWFLQRRDPDNAVLPGRWEFPGGKVHRGEAVADALRRELQEELGWKPASVTALEAVEHRYVDRTVRLHPFFCEGAFELRTSLSWGWFTLDEILGLPTPEANRSLLKSMATESTPSPEIQRVRN